MIKTDFIQYFSQTSLQLHEQGNYFKFSHNGRTIDKTTKYEKKDPASLEVTTSYTFSWDQPGVRTMKIEAVMSSMGQKDIYQKSFNTKDRKINICFKEY